MKKILLGLLITMFCIVPFTMAEESGVTKIVKETIETTDNKVLYIKNSFDLIKQEFIDKRKAAIPVYYMEDTSDPLISYYLIEEIGRYGLINAVYAKKEILIGEDKMEIFEEGIRNDRSVKHWFKYRYFIEHKIVDRVTTNEIEVLESVSIWDTTINRIFKK